MSPRTEAALTWTAVGVATLVIGPLSVLAWLAIWGHDGALKAANAIAGRLPKRGER